MGRHRISVVLAGTLMLLASALPPTADAAGELGDCPPEVRDTTWSLTRALGSLWTWLDLHAWATWWKGATGAAQWCGSDTAPSSFGDIGWLAAENAHNTDITASFVALLARIRAGDNVIPAHASDLKFLLVPGLFTNSYPGYMQENLARLGERGLRAEKIDLNTAASVSENASVIAEAIRRAAHDGSRLVIVGQSKGGVDAAAALAEYPDLARHVQAFIALQAPYGGTPIASDIASCPRLRERLGQAIRAALGGQLEALTDLSYAARRGYVTAHPFPSNIRTISVTTARNDWQSLVKTTAQYLSDVYSESSDGLVLPADAEIPGSSVVRLTDMDHAESVMRGLAGFSNYYPGEVTEALVALALSEPAGLGELR